MGYGDGGEEGGFGGDGLGGGLLEKDRGAEAVEFGVEPALTRLRGFGDDRVDGRERGLDLAVFRLGLRQPPTNYPDRAKTRPRGIPEITGAISESGMAHISGFERSQLLLLPEAIDDYVGGDNPVQFIDAFVDGLDLSTSGFERVAARATGAPDTRRAIF